MVKKLFGTLLFLTGIMAGLAGYGFYLTQKKPEKNIEWFLHNRKEFSGNKVVICIGDSITHGRVSANYVEMLSEKIKYDGFVSVNAGVNSELAYNVLQRIDDIIKSKPDFVTILIGTNDANATLSDANADRYIRDMNLPQKPTIDRYREDLTAIVKKLKKDTDARIALLSLPPIGEEIDSEAFERTVLFSRVIKEVSQAEKVSYLPLNEKMSEYLREKKHVPYLSYEKGWLGIMVKGAMMHYFFGKSFNEISEANGFLLVTDFLHLNSRGAEMIAELIEGFVKEIPQERRKRIVR